MSTALAGRRGGLDCRWAGEGRFRARVPFEPSCKCIHLATVAKVRAFLDRRRRHKNHPNRMKRIPPFVLSAEIRASLSAVGKELVSRGEVPPPRDAYRDTRGEDKRTGGSEAPMGHG